MYDRRTLEDVDLGTVHSAFRQAFSDHPVGMDMAPRRFEAMLRRRGFDPRLSMGAFKNGVLVGFLLSGVRRWRGLLTAYDAGTGVVPEHRGRGVTRRMFRDLRRLLAEEGVARYLLEVVRGNAPALELTRQLGFRTTRGLVCFRAPRRRLRPGPGCGAELKEVPVRGLDWRAAQGFWDVEPSWQNSTDSVLAASPELTALGAFAAEEMVGYGVIEPATGDLPQLAVRWDHRDQGVGRAILGGLVAACEADRVSVVNVEEGADAVRGFLEHLGFSAFTEQHEMVLDLRKG